jgi:aminomethyltransferase
MLRQTPLNPAHRRLGARLVDFGGWEMPLHYGSQIAEHHSVRGKAGAFDVSHMLALDMSGPDTRAFLRHALANDVAKLESPGGALYSCLLNEHGRILDDLIVYFVGQNRYRVIVNAGTAEKDLAWLESLRNADTGRTDIAPRRDLAIIAVQGPSARALVWQAFPETRAPTEALPRFHAVQCGEFFVARTGYTGEDGFELMLPSNRAVSVWEALLGAGTAPCGLGARDTLRLEAGMNLYGQDMDEAVTPKESGLAWTVDMSAARDFVGRKALESERPVRALIGLVLLDPGVLRAHQRVLTTHGEGGTTSGGFAPTLNRSIALARVPIQVLPGVSVRVEVRGRQLEALAVRPPFVRNGKNLLGPIEERQ